MRDKNNFIGILEDACHMEYLPEIDILEDPEVYPPSDDSLLLINSLDVRKGERLLEIGCGSGIVSIHCAINGAIVSCGDINPRAIEITRKNASKNKVDLEIRLTNVYSAFPESFDTIVFNLPYLPVQEEGELAKAWSGGKDGLGPLPELLAHAPEHLFPKGRVVVVVSSLMDQNRLKEVIGSRDTKILGTLPLFFERLDVLEIKIEPGPEPRESPD